MVKASLQQQLRGADRAMPVAERVGVMRMLQYSPGDVSQPSSQRRNASHHFLVLGQ